MTMAEELMTTVVRPTFGYYKQPNGWVTVSPITELEMLHYTKQGWTRLNRYPNIEMNNAYMATHPFEALFMAGGAKEMPVEQVIQMGFAMNPPIVPTCRKMLNQFHRGHVESCWQGAQPVEFPQLEGLEIQSFSCRFCENVHPTEAGRRQHEMVAHKDERGNISMGDALAGALAPLITAVSTPADKPLSRKELENGN